MTSSSSSVTSVTPSAAASVAASPGQVVRVSKVKGANKSAGASSKSKTATPTNSKTNSAVDAAAATDNTASSAHASHHRRSDGPTMPLKLSHITNMKTSLGIQRMKSGIHPPIQAFMRSEIKYVIGHIRPVSSRVADNDVLDALVRCYPGFDREMFRGYLNTEDSKLAKCGDKTMNDPNCIFISAGPFKDMISEVSNELSAVSTNMATAWSSRARGLLQLFIERMIMKLMTMSYKIAKSNGRNTLDKKDISLVVEILRTMTNRSG